MSESPKHLLLVKKIRDSIRKQEGIAPNLVIAEDHEENTITMKTPEGFRPDVYYFDNKRLIIGEAKTSHDLHNGHSDAQFESYLSYCKTMSLDYETTLVIGVPWQDFIEIKNKFKKIKPKTVKIRIINDFDYIEELS